MKKAEFKKYVKTYKNGICHSCKTIYVRGFLNADETKLNTLTGTVNIDDSYEFVRYIIGVRS